MSRRVLDEILAMTALELDALRSAPPEDVGHRPLDVPALLRRQAGDPLRLIAEIKLRSPSAGPLSRRLSVRERASLYAGSGARMISVLVDRAHFDGSYEHLSQARAVVDVPLLCKGFVIDPVQVTAARRAGADAVLLIVRVLQGGALAELHHAVLEAGLTPIVEVVDEAELERAWSVSAPVIGVNARDLDTLKMDAERASRVLTRIADGAPERRACALFFSGLSAPADVLRIAATPADGALIGEALMRADEPGPLLRSMLSAAG